MSQQMIARRGPTQSKCHTSGKIAFESGDYTTALDLFKITLENYKKLNGSKKRNTVEVQLKVNIATTKTCIPDLKIEGLHELHDLTTEFEGHDDKLFLGKLHYNTGIPLVSAEQYPHLEKALDYVSDTTDGENLKEKFNMKEVILEHMIEILNQPSDDDDASNSADEARFKRMEELAEVYSVRLDSAANENYIENERLVYKCGNMLTVLAFQHLDRHQVAKTYTDRCFHLFKQNDDHVLAEQWNDLGLICTEIGDYFTAKACFRKVVPFFRSAESNSVVSTAGLQNMGVVCLLENDFIEAIHCFQHALTMLENINVTSQPLRERRVHLYLNIGVTWSSMGRTHGWKTFEAYYNAAVFASKIKSEVILRLDALHGLVISTMMVLNYGNSLHHFLLECVFKDIEVPEVTQHVYEFKEREDVQTVVKNVETFAVALSNIQLYVLSTDD